MADIYDLLDKAAEKYEELFGEKPAYFMMPANPQDKLDLIERALKDGKPIVFDMADGRKY